MKTIQIPLELAEEILHDIMKRAMLSKDEWGSGKIPIDEYIPMSYFKLRELVVETKNKRTPLTFKDLSELDKVTPTIKYLVELNNIQKVEAFVKSTEETYVFDGDMWVVMD